MGDALSPPRIWLWPDRRAYAHLAGYPSWGLGILKIIATAAAFCIAALGALPAAALTYPEAGVTAAEVAAVLQQKGLSAEISTDDWGDPLIKSRSNGATWHILFYNCDKKGRCASVQYRIGLDLTDGMSYAQCNEWNDTKRFARCMLDEEMDPYLKWDIATNAGFTSEALAMSVDQWDTLVPAFATFIRTKTAMLPQVGGPLAAG